MKSRLMFSPCACARVPIPSIGPFWRARFVSENVSLPSALKIGVMRKTSERSQSSCFPVASRRLRRRLQAVERGGALRFESAGRKRESGERERQSKFHEDYLFAS